MPLPLSAVGRQRIHLRRIVLEGWQRNDGLFDIEARLIDTKDQDYRIASGVRAAGEPVHDIWLRVTVDQRLDVIDAAASSDAVPYPGYCDTIAPDYRGLVGLNLANGFRRATMALLGGVKGCSHLSELAGLLPTAAVQTFATLVRETDDPQPGQHPFQLDQCHALATTSETVRRYYPRWFREQKTGPDSGQAGDRSTQHHFNNKEDA